VYYNGYGNGNGNDNGIGTENVKVNNCGYAN